MQPALDGQKGGRRQQETDGQKLEDEGGKKDGGSDAEIDERKKTRPLGRSGLGTLTIQRT